MTTHKERLKKQYSRQNNYIKENKDRISLVVPLGLKDKIKEKSGNKSVNAWILELIYNALNDDK